MQKKLLAAVVASLVAGQALAVEVYNEEGTTLNIEGKVGLVIDTSTGDSGDSSLGMSDASNRINFKFGHDFDNGWNASSVVEWGFRAVDGDIDDSSAAYDKGDLFYNRLGNVSLGHDSYGTVTAGKAWSVTYDVSGWTDQSFIGAGGTGAQAMGIYSGRGKDANDVGVTNSGDTDGTARADDVLQYRLSLMGINVGLQYQMKGSGEFDSVNPSAYERDFGYGLALSYEPTMIPVLEGLGVGMTYNATTYGSELGTPLGGGVYDYSGSDVSTSMTFGAKYERELFYLAGTMGMFGNKTGLTGGNIGGGLDKKSTGYELIGKINIPQKTNISLMGGYNMLTVDETYEVGATPEGKLSDIMVGAAYGMGPLEFSAEYVMRDRTDGAGTQEKDTIYAFQTLYYF